MKQHSLVNISHGVEKSGRHKMARIQNRDVKSRVEYRQRRPRRSRKSDDLEDTKYKVTREAKHIASACKCHRAGWGCFCGVVPWLPPHRIRHTWCARTNLDAGSSENGRGGVGAVGVWRVTRQLRVAVPASMTCTRNRSIGPRSVHSNTRWVLPHDGNMG